MKKLTALLIFICIYQITLADSWTQMASLPGTARQGAAGFVIGTKAYMGTGYWAQSACLNDLWEWDQPTNTWSQKASLPGMVRNAGYAFAVNGKGYMGFGTNCGGIFIFLDDFYEYDPAANSWTVKASYGGGIIGYGAGFVLNNKIYYGTGTDLTFPTVRNDFWEYNPVTDTWSQKANFAGTKRQSAVAFAVGNMGYLGTGSDSAHISTRDFWQYNPASNSWLQIDSIPGQAKYWAAAFAIGNYGYVGSGNTGVINTGDFWQYNPATNSWTNKATLGGVARNDAFGFSIGNKGYIGLGAYNQFLKDLWEYTPDTSTSISDLQIANYNVQLTPNPAHDFIKVSISNRQPSSSPVKVAIANMAGKLTYASTIINNETVIDVNHFAKGVYTVSIDDGKQRLVKKFQKN